ncbi:MAG: TIR domain-containing protein [Methanobrevibacter sp.]|jgi:hypothetical protein|nr:TIR domain-containing protein [Candidatus Methanovirga procula]
MAYRNKTYIAFDGDTDMDYYNMLKAWKANNNIDFDFYDAHELNTARDSSLTESIKNQLRVRFDNSKVFVILVGKNTKWNRKYIPWEIKQAVNRDLPIIVVNINNKRKMCNETCPKLLRKKLAIHIPFKSKILQYAIQTWSGVMKIIKIKVNLVLITIKIQSMIL